jgi:bifunctional DNase/RNase
VADIPVEIWQLLRDEEEHDVVILRDEEERLLPIAIGVCEAAAIWVKLAPELAAPYLRRPWSHDLMQAMLERLGAKLERVVIDGFTGGTFYATLHLRYREAELVVDSRPSDAIALVLRMPAPLFVNDEVMAEAGFRFDETQDDSDDGPPDLWDEGMPQ